MELDALLESCRRGDDLAWEALVRRYQGRVFGICIHYMRDREEARDAAQEVFVKLYERLDTLDQRAAFLPWLIRLTRNACIDRLRRLKVRTPEHAVTVEDAYDLAAPGPSPEDRSLASTRRGLLYRALDELSEESREVILLREIQELKLKEVAALLAIPEGTVKSRAHRARLELAAALRGLDPSYGT